MFEILFQNVLFSQYSVAAEDSGQLIVVYFSTEMIFAAILLSAVALILFAHRLSFTLIQFTCISYVRTVLLHGFVFKLLSSNLPLTTSLLLNSTLRTKFSVRGRKVGYKLSTEIVSVNFITKRVETDY